MLTHRNTIFAFIAVICVLALIHTRVQVSAWAYVAATAAFLAVIAWGSYNVSSGYFMKVICRAETKSPEVALTFDDGPADAHTSAILDVLGRYSVPAAFFCIGRRMVERPALFKRVHDEGHIAGNHSFSHHVLFDLFTAGVMKRELDKVNAEGERIAGRKMKLFRPPYGVTTPALARAVAKSGMIPVGWSIRSMDTVTKDENELVARVMNGLGAGDIILLHDTCEVTLKALPALIEKIREKGFTIVRLDRLLNIPAYA